MSRAGRRSPRWCRAAHRQVVADLDTGDLPTPAGAEEELAQGLHGVVLAVGVPAAECDGPGVTGPLDPQGVTLGLTGCLGVPERPGDVAAVRRAEPHGEVPRGVPGNVSGGDDLDLAGAVVLELPHQPVPRGGVRRVVGDDVDLAGHPDVVTCAADALRGRGDRRCRGGRAAGCVGGGGGRQGLEQQTACECEARADSKRGVSATSHVISSNGPVQQLAWFPTMLDQEAGRHKTYGV